MVLRKARPVGNFAGKYITMKIIITAILLFVGCNYARAHAIWIETAASGTIGKKHEAKIFLGEYAANERDSIHNWFSNMASFTVWVVTPEGQRTQLQTTPKGTYFLAEFTPAGEGIYYFTIDHPVAMVYDGTKIHYHAQAKVQVGKSQKGAENITKLNEAIMLHKDAAFKQHTALETTLRFNNAAIPDGKLSIQSPEGWAKEVSTDQESKVAFNPAWKGLYLLEGSFTENVSGTYEKQEYKMIWHCITQCVQVQ